MNRHWLLAALAVPALALANEPAPQEPVYLEVPTEEAPYERGPIVFGGDVVVESDGPAEDLFLMGQQVTVGHPVADNTFLMSQIAMVQAPVQGDLLAMAEIVRIDAPVGGDVYALGKQVVLTEKGAIGGHLYARAAEVRLEGPVGGDVSVGAGELVLAGPVAGDVWAEVGVLKLSGGSVGGDLAYAAPTSVDGLESLVAGTVTFTQQLELDEEAEVEPAPPSVLSRVVSWTLWTGWTYGSLLLVGFVFLGLGGEPAGRVARVLGEQPARALGVGFVVMSVLPVASLVAMALILPLPLGVLGLLVLAVALYAGQLFAAQALGDQIVRTLQPGALGNPYISMAVGLVPLVLLGLLPWLGTLVWLAATLAGVGGLWMGLRRRSM
jgi:cytoskeletal protein CcmA (bactofilin family)